LHTLQREPPMTITHDIPNLRRPRAAAFAFAVGARID
jgi:hypothetical protein